MNNQLVTEIRNVIERTLKQRTGVLSSEQRVWFEGYAAGVADTCERLARSNGHGGAHAASGQRHGQAMVTLLYASHSGNGKGISRKAQSVFAAAGIPVRVSDMALYKPRDLKAEKNLLVIISTHGDGVPPSSAESLFDFLDERPPDLKDLTYSVLALGDKSYVNFCKAGVDLDRKLSQLGGKRLLERVDCDVDFSAAAEAWTGAAVEELKKRLPGPDENVPAGSSFSTTPEASLDEGRAYSARDPFYATVLSRVNLNGRGSGRETYHIELSVESSGIRYNPGDACGIVPVNSESLVALLLEALSLNGSETVAEHEGKPLSEVLKRMELTVLSPEVIKRHNVLANNATLTGLPGDPSRLREFIYGRDFIDLCREYPVKYSADELARVLRCMPARLYSIASSPAAMPEEIHLLVAALRYRSQGRDKEGVGSTFWADRIKEGDKVPIYVKSNEGFRLPADKESPLIMVGPGTGVAPFRSFVEERAQLGYNGRSWLFFGNPHFTTDFLYQTDWQQFVDAGSLTRMNVAFSRDQEEKFYVQHQILRNSRDLYSWLQEGARIYVCGDMKHMAPDVFNAFVAVVEKEGNLTREKALEHVKEIKRSGRYVEDVY